LRQKKPSFSYILSDLFPTPQQTSLQRACLYSGEAGRQAGVAWVKAIQASEDTLQEEYIKSLLPLLCHALPRNGVEVEHAFLTILRTASLWEDLRTKTYRRICREVLSSLTAAGIPFMLLGGAVLAETVYRDPALRHSHDIDILLGEADPCRAINLLASVGFVPLAKDVSPAWPNLQCTHKSGLRLMLHRQLFCIPPYQIESMSMWTRCQTHVIADVPVHVLSPEDTLLHLCGRVFLSPSRASLSWVCDTWLLIDRHPSLDWDALLESIVHRHLTLQLAVMLGYVAEELQAPIPQSFLERLYEQASQADTFEYEVALWGVRAGGRVRLKELLLKTQDWRTGAFILKWMLFPSPAYLRSVEQIHLSGLLPLLYVSRPLRYIARSFLRRWRR